MFMGMILRARNFNYDNFCTLLFLEPYAYFLNIENGLKAVGLLEN